MDSYRVLLVEDDHGLRDVLTRGLRAEDFEVVTAADGESAMRSVDIEPDVIVLDIGLPDADGRDVCQAMRGRGIDSPVIFLTARRDVSDRLSGFASGGDDYLAKPFAFAELVARVRSLARRHSASSRPVDDDGLRVDPIRHGLTHKESFVDLSPIEFKLLARLLVEPGGVVRRQQLRAAAWPDGAIVSDNTLDQYVTKLRRKVAEVGADELIRSARGVGYYIVRTR